MSIDLPTSVGYFTLAGRVIEGRSDSIDAGTAPDGIPSNCSIVLAAVGIPASRPYVVADDAPDTIIQLRPINAFVKDGLLYAPKDGATAADASDMLPVAGIPLVANLQDGIDLSGWVWSATLSPLPGDNWWKPYTIPISGSPGDTVTLGQAALAANTTNIVNLPSDWIQTSTQIAQALEAAQAAQVAAENSNNASDAGTANNLSTGPLSIAALSAAIAGYLADAGVDGGSP